MVAAVAVMVVVVVIVVVADHVIMQLHQMVVLHSKQHPEKLYKRVVVAVVVVDFQRMVMMVRFQQSENQVADLICYSTIFLTLRPPHQWTYHILQPHNQQTLQGESTKLVEHEPIHH